MVAPDRCCSNLPSKSVSLDEPVIEKHPLVGKGVFFVEQTYLLNADLCSRCCLAGETSLLNLLERDDAVLGCVDSEVAAHEGSRASYLGASSLTHKHFAGADSLATKALHAEACAGVVVDVLT